MVGPSNLAVPALVPAFRHAGHTDTHSTLAIVAHHLDVGDRTGRVLRVDHAEGGCLHRASNICVDACCGDYRRALLRWCHRLLALAIAGDIDGGLVVQQHGA